ncbi:MAG: thiamine pyrophosphate-binding protein [Actinophytocola sp.]|uniref:thiamine pyrophosphate-binding protein n=1 Tax=Actinophytocola sp. TaxID=1872138 RepID=UPI0013278DDF|nr:thiamine pyrophosphate-binding protein [Actinophytocola sp.]MPZ80070.1 thiamine pyrophosphate-binding protein [Actinophytocola sp.]
MTMRVYEALARICAGAGVDTAFVLLGDANLLWALALTSDSDVRLVRARHENAAVLMADGYARRTGRVGLASLTCGPGLTQAATALTTAARARTPLVVVVGDTPRGLAYSLQEFPQQALVASTGARYRQLSNAPTATNGMRQAFAEAARDRIPVVVGVPVDVQAEFCPDEPDLAAACRMPSVSPARAPVAAPEAGDLDRVAARLLDARRPVIVAGRGAVFSGARDALLAVADEIGAYYGNTLRANGFFRDCAYDIGIVGGFSTDSARGVLESADVVLAVGASLGHYTTDGGGLFRGAHVTQLDISPQFWCQGVRAADDYLVGDARLGAEGLLARIRAAGRPSGRDDRIAVNPAGPGGDTTGRFEGDGAGALDPRRATEILNLALSEESFVVIGAGHFWNFAVLGLAAPKVGQVEYAPIHFGATGDALALAIGSWSADRSTPVYAIEGDGSLFMALPELDTLARERARVCVLVMNDSAYGAEVHKLRQLNLPEDCATYPTTDFASLARAMGLDGVTVDRDDGTLDTVLADFAESGRPTVVDVRVSRSVVSTHLPPPITMSHGPVAP